MHHNDREPITSAERRRSISHKHIRKPLTSWLNIQGSSPWLTHQFRDHHRDLRCSFTQVFSDGTLHHILDGLNEEHSNWMRYVNPARAVEEQNLVACQSGLNIYFYTVKTLQPGQELLVWYCPEFAQRCNYPPLGRLAMDRIGKFVCWSLKIGQKSKQ